MGKLIKRFMTALFVVFLLLTLAFADDEREEDRVRDAGVVMKEVLNFPDNIPQDLIDKAEGVIILPSVKKGAFGVGGSYGRGGMLCRGRAASTTKVNGGLRRCMRLRASASDSSSAARPPTSCCW